MSWVAGFDLLKKVPDFRGPWQRAGILGAYLLLSLGCLTLQPKFMEKGLNLAPVMTVLSLFFWTWVLGPLGALLAVPMTMAAIKLVLEGSDEARWLVDLMGPGRASEAEANGEQEIAE